MPKRSSKPPSDPNKAARSIVQRATESEINEDMSGVQPAIRKLLKEISDNGEPVPPKNPAAQELGRLGGLKGGKARAASMTPEQLSNNARKAATARWKREKS